MYRRWMVVPLAILLVAAFSIGPASATGWFGHSKEPVHYLALGTSLAAGIQADRQTCESVLSPVSYPKFLEWKIRKRVRNARLVNLGCPGETSATFINGGICYTDGDSQLKRAIDFLADNREKTVLITIDMGANDVLPCFFDPRVPPEDIQSCVEGKILELVGNLGIILNEIRSVDPETPFIGSNYYNPLLVTWFEDPSLARQLAELQNALNAALKAVYKQFGIPVANVARAFRSNKFKDTNGNGIPENVDRICAWTWMCECENIHANWIGYWKMADAFEKKLPRSLTCRPHWWLHKYWH